MPFISKTGSTKIFDGDMRLFRKLNEAFVYNEQNFSWYWKGPPVVDEAAPPQQQFVHNIAQDFVDEPVKTVRDTWGVIHYITSDHPAYFFNHAADPGEFDQDFMYVSTDNQNVHREGLRGSTTASGRTADDFFAVNFLDITPFVGDPLAVLDRGYSEEYPAFNSSVNNKPDVVNDNYGFLLYRGSNFPSNFVIHPDDPGEFDQNLLYNKYNMTAHWIDHGTYSDPLALQDRGYVLNGESDFGTADNVQYATNENWGHLPYVSSQISSTFLAVLPDPGEFDQNLLYNKYNMTAHWIDHGTYGDPTAIPDKGHTLILDGGMGDISSESTGYIDYGEWSSIGYNSSSIRANYYGGWRYDQEYVINNTNMVEMFI